MAVMFTDAVEGARERERLLESLESYRRGLADAPVLRKWSAGPPAEPERAAAGRKESDPGDEDVGTESPMTFVISNEEVDRHGDVVLAFGWRLQAYRRNPVFLWAHDYSRPVIGRALAVWPEPEQLLARMEFAPTDFAREVAALYRSGYQQGVSVGFKPLRYEERRQERTGSFLGIRFLEQELLEVSAVPVPANRHALRRALPAAFRLEEEALTPGLSPRESGELGWQSEEESVGMADLLAALRAATW